MGVWAVRCGGVSVWGGGDGRWGRGAGGGV